MTPTRARAVTVARLLCALALLTVFGNASAELVHGRGLLWKVEGGAGGAPSHVFGTLHSDDPRVLDLDPATERAFREARRYAFELDFRKDVQARMSRAMFDREPPTLRQQLDPPDWQRALDAARARGVAERAVPLMEPWALAITLAVPPVDPASTLDRTLFDRAVERGRPVTGLETADEQIALFQQLATEVQLGMLRRVLELQAEQRIGPMFEQLRAAWLAGNLESLMAISKGNPMLPDAAGNAAFEQRVIDARNERMARRMQPVIDRGGAFVAIGALHLPGERGVLRLLQEAGYTVEAVE